jgi:hypothetical protein
MPRLKLEVPQLRHGLAVVVLAEFPHQLTVLQIQS